MAEDQNPSFEPEKTEAQCESGTQPQVSEEPMEVQVAQDENAEPQPVTEDESTQQTFMIFYDFDCTISFNHVYSHSQGRILDQFQQFYGAKQITQWFGGEDRITLLRTHFENLKNFGAELIIISFGYADVIQYCLSELKMDHFFSSIHGRTTPSLKKHGFRKAFLVKEMMEEKNCPTTNAVFLDDDHNNVDSVKNQNICRYVYVNGTTGITAEETSKVEGYIESLVNQTNQEELWNLTPSFSWPEN